MPRITLAWLTLLLLGGCALSPQLVTLHPNPRVPDANVGHGSPVQVRVVDRREDQVIGTRGGVYGKTALIRTANDLSVAIRQTVRNSLQRLGFDTTGVGRDAPRLTVEICGLSYVPDDGALVSWVRTRACLRAVAKRGDTTYRATFRTRVKHQLLLTPDAEHNEAMITQVLERSLERLLNDDTLLQFLAGIGMPPGVTSTSQTGHTAPAIEPTRPAPDSTVKTPARDRTSSSGRR